MERVEVESGSTTVAKALNILFYLRDARKPQGISSIAGALGLQKSGAHRLVKSLEARNLVIQLEDRSYALGLGLVALASGVSSSNSLLAAAKPILEDLAGSVSETVFLVTDQAGELRVAAKAEGTSFLRAAPDIGSVIPASKTAVGKLYTVYAPERLSTVPRVSHDKKEKVRVSGYAINREEWQPGLSVIAVPVMIDGGLCGALALATVTQRMDLLSEDKLSQLLKLASNRITASLS